MNASSRHTNIDTTANNTSKGDSISFPKHKWVQALGNRLNQFKFGPGCNNIRICYGLEMAAAALVKQNIQECQTHLYSVRKLILSDLKVSVEYASIALDEGIESKLNSKTESEKIFYPVTRKNVPDHTPDVTAIEFICDFNRPKSTFQTFKGRANLADSLKNLHEAIYLIEKIKSSDAASVDSVELVKKALVQSYTSIRPSEKKNDIATTLNKMSASPSRV